MNDINKTLANSLDIDPIDYNKDLNVIDLTKKDDGEFASENIRQMIMKGNDLIDNLILLAKSSQDADAYDVASKLIKNLSELNKDLLEVNKRKKELKLKDNDSDSDDVDDSKKVAFKGSTSDLIRLINDTKTESKIEE